VLPRGDHVFIKEYLDTMIVLLWRFHGALMMLPKCYLVVIIEYLGSIMVLSRSCYADIKDYNGSIMMFRCHHGTVVVNVSMMLQKLYHVVIYNV
jgi:hypothetical protein